MVRWGMVIDLRKCIGCQACTVACKAENLTPQGVHWNRVFKVEEGKYPNVRRLFLPLLCMHCEDPSCVSVCPTGASYKRPDGIVAIDSGKCIGCMYCIGACPYGVRTYINEVKPYFPSAGLSQIEQYRNGEHPNGVVEKCDFCLQRVENGLEPACVQTCPPRARYFGDLDDPQSEVSRIVKSGNAVQLLRESNTDPSVYYVPPPNMTLEQFNSLTHQSISKPALQRMPLSALALQWTPWISSIAAALVLGPLLGLYVRRRKELFSKSERLRLAIVDCAICGGCEVAIADLGEQVLNLLSDRVELVYAPILMSAREFGPVDVVFVVGSVRNEEDLKAVREAREKAKVLVAFGTCPGFGGLNNLSNLYSKEELLDAAYVNALSMEHDGSGKTVPSEKFPGLLGEIRPLSDYVKVDVTLPGCPPPAQVIRDALDVLLHGVPSRVEAKKS
jgi:Fe-S-cluster-containing dehydrogenase component/coenzyme F420-reducing hydrogenase gamma subunit